MKLLDYLVRDERGYRARRIDEDHESRLQRLEAENDELREVLRVVVSALEDRGIVVQYGGEVADAEAPRGNPSTEAKFACGRCGTLVRASHMERIDGELVCADCNA